MRFPGQSNLVLVYHRGARYLNQGKIDRLATNSRWKQNHSHSMRGAYGKKSFTLFLIALRRSRTEPPLYDLNFRRSAKEMTRFLFVF